MSKSCPYYKQGLCHSPLLPKPEDYVTDASKCIGNFYTCRYYPKDDLNPEQGDSTEKVDVNIYPIVNVLEDTIESGCPNFKLSRTSKGVVAICSIMGRVMTRSQAKLCSERWASCPISMSI